MNCLFIRNCKLVVDFEKKDNFLHWTLPKIVGLPEQDSRI